jgi:hypothetical protein
VQNYESKWMQSMTNLQAALEFKRNYILNISEFLNWSQCRPSFECRCRCIYICICTYVIRWVIYPEVVWRSGNVAAGILNIGTRQRLVTNFTKRLLYPQGNRMRNQVKKRLYDTKSRYWFWREGNLCTLA